MLFQKLNLFVGSILFLLLFHHRPPRPSTFQSYSPVSSSKPWLFTFLMPFYTPRPITSSKPRLSILLIPFNASLPQILLPFVIFKTQALHLSHSLQRLSTPLYPQILVPSVILKTRVLHLSHPFYASPRPSILKSFSTLSSSKPSLFIFIVPFYSFSTPFYP